MNIIDCIADIEKKEEKEEPAVVLMSNISNQFEASAEVYMSSNILQL